MGGGMESVESFNRRLAVGNRRGDDPDKSVR